MKAVYIQLDSLLRDSHVDLNTAPATWQLMPATLEAVRLLATQDTLVVLYCSCVGAAAGDGAHYCSTDTLNHVARQVASGGGRVDSIAACVDPIPADGAPGAFPGLVWAASARYGLRPEQSYLLGDAPADVTTATATGVRPVIVLGDRTVEQVFGRTEIERDFPVAPDLSTAVSYIDVEADITQQIGTPREEPVSVPAEVLQSADAEYLPALSAVSDLAKGLEERLGRSRIQRRDIARWLFLFVAGALGLSLGVAYLLTDLYRAQPFPGYVYYLTLQFIPRTVRGLLFILVGAGIVALAARSMLRGNVRRAWLKR